MLLVSNGSCSVLKAVHLCLVDLMAKVNASPKKKVQAKLNTTGQLMAPPADPSVNAPRKFSGFTGKMWRLRL